MRDSPLVIVGRVRRAHGIRGEMAIEVITDEPDAVFAAGRRVFAGTVGGDPDPDGRTLHVVRSSAFKGGEGRIVAFAEVTDRTQAERWRDRYLLVPGDELTPAAEGEVYLHELPGMRVVLAGGAEVGLVKAVYELPQGLMLAVDREGQGRDAVLVPYDARTVAEVDTEARVIRIDPVPGLID